MPGSQFKVLFSNREGKLINKTLTGKPTISLREQDDVNKDIQSYVHAKVAFLRGGPLDKNGLIDRIERTIVKKAEGMQPVIFQLN